MRYPNSKDTAILDIMGKDLIFSILSIKDHGELSYIYMLSVINAADIHTNGEVGVKVNKFVDSSFINIVYPYHVAEVNFSASSDRKSWNFAYVRFMECTKCWSKMDTRAEMTINISEHGINNSVIYRESDLKGMMS